MEEFRALVGICKCRTKVGFICIILEIHINTFSKNQVSSSNAYVRKGGPLYTSYFYKMQKLLKHTTILTSRPNIRTVE